MFGGLFVGYALYHGRYPEMFAEGASHLSWYWGAINTVVLLISSFTMALGIYYAQTNNRKKTVSSLWITFLCGCAFLVIKTIEYSSKIHHGLLPGKFFSFKESANDNLAMYYGFYFSMTGLHGIHVVVGMGLIAWVALRAQKGEFSSKYYTPVEGVGLFWHLVDLVWIFLFPLLYLVG
jgi:cytochrome c oxidase subunit 3